ncbi:hypothetical protein [Streptomyces sp. PanSC9]|uniref:hypothetical protein n=1 Tax=Streptomyces sp. PanSC9 TaxID=1520461 RepID=UPI000F4A4A19|nr:hypothetical protein [Streptomyces sp. PanSC9]ROP55361.1 uncharacterized membrane protein YgaE (UPF0421/DUF939 family) [Streptomyces sp. PanSC9]
MQGVRVSAITARIARAGCAEAARATVAAGLTWQTCAVLLHTHDPYAGAVAALLIVETTVVRTVGAALRYGAGCLLGVLVAVPGALYTEPAMLGLGFVVFASVLLARQGFLGHHGLHVPTTALITYALVRGRHSGELTSHLAEIVVGIAFGLACSALLWPTVRVRSAERALEDLRVLIARHLDGLADAAVRRERPRQVLGTTWEDDLDTALARARATVDEAHESMRWNVRPTARRRRWHLDRRVLETLTDVAGRVAATGRLLDSHPSAAGVPSPASAASAPDAGLGPGHGGVTGRTPDSPGGVRTAAPERVPGSPGPVQGHVSPSPGPAKAAAPERVPGSPGPVQGHVSPSPGPGEAAATERVPASPGPVQGHVSPSPGPGEAAATERVPASPGPVQGHVSPSPGPGEAAATERVPASPGPVQGHVSPSPGPGKAAATERVPGSPGPVQGHVSPSPGPGKAAATERVPGSPGPVQGHVSPSPGPGKAAATERVPGSPGPVQGHVSPSPGPGKAAATERVPGSPGPGVAAAPESVGPGGLGAAHAGGPARRHPVPALGPGHPGSGNTGAAENAGAWRVPGSPAPAEGPPSPGIPGEAAAAGSTGPVHGDRASAGCPGRGEPVTAGPRDPHPAPPRHPAALGRFGPGHPAVAGAHGTGDVLAEPYARLLRTTALCVYSCRGGRPHPALPAARRAVARLGAPAAEPTGADAEDRRLLRHLDQALTRLSAPAPAPPARPARPRPTSTPLRPSRRR